MAYHVTSLVYGSAKTARYANVLPHVVLNNMSLINQHFNKHDVLKQHFSKLLHPQNGPIHLGLTMVMSIVSYKHFAGMLFHHMPASFCKQSFRDVWAAEPEILDNTSRHKFRNHCKEDVSQYVVRAWQMASGNFEPRNIMKRGEHFTRLRSDFSGVTRAVQEQRWATANST